MGLPRDDMFLRNSSRQAWHRQRHSTALGVQWHVWHPRVVGGTWAPALRFGLLLFYSGGLARQANR